MKMLSRNDRGAAIGGAPERKALPPPADAPRGGERRSGANKQKEALFYDTGERSRLWRAFAASVIVNVLLTLVLMLCLLAIIWLFTVALRPQVFGIVEHSDGRPTTTIGKLEPLHGDASLGMLQSNAIHYVDDLFSVSTFGILTKTKASVLSRTASGKAAEKFANATFDDHFTTYKSGHVAVSDIDCRNETDFRSPTEPVRFECYYTETPTDVNDVASPDAQPKRFVSHVELVQSRGKNDPDILYTNPDEVYVTYIDQETRP
jgi:hypothetical protein